MPSSGLLAGLGLGVGALGSLFGGLGGDTTRSRLEDIANTPGVDVDAETLNSLTTLEKYLPRAQGIGSSLDEYYGTALEKSMERSQPGYATRRAALLKNLDDWIAGKVSPETVSEIYRNTAAQAVRGGYSGAPLQLIKSARDIGRASESRKQYAMSVMPSLSAIFPTATPTDISKYAGLSPTELINLRSQERAQKMAIEAQAAGVAGQTGAWGNYLAQMGGLAAGAGLYGLSRPSQGGAFGSRRYLNSWNPSAFYEGENAPSSFYSS